MQVLLGRELEWGLHGPLTFEGLIRLFNFSYWDLGDGSEDKYDDNDGDKDKENGRGEAGASRGDGTPHDSWMYLPGADGGAARRATGSSGRMHGSRNRSRDCGALALHPELADSSVLRSALSECMRVCRRQSLLTVELSSIHRDHTLK